MKNIYEIKISRFKWEYVLSDSYQSLDAYCKANNADWRSVGMLSRDEIAHIRATARTI
jgi:hypothetical protein